ARQRTKKRDESCDEDNPSSESSKQVPAETQIAFIEAEAMEHVSFTVTTDHESNDTAAEGCDSRRHHDAEDVQFMGGHGKDSCRNQDGLSRQREGDVLERDDREDRGVAVGTQQVLE